MEKEILISIRPEFVEKILNGEKTIEIRKTMPKCELPCKVYIYCTKGKKLYKCVSTFDEDLLNGKVVAEFTLNKVEEFEFELWDNKTFESIGNVYYDEDTGEGMVNVFETGKEIEDTKLLKDSCLTVPQLRKYLGKGFSICYAWHIDDLIVYDKPKELVEFRKLYNEREGGWQNLRVTRPPQNWCYVTKEKMLDVNCDDVSIDNLDILYELFANEKVEVL